MYRIRQFANCPEAEEALGGYVSSAYGSGLFSASHCVGRKSVPVYALDGSALSGLDSIRLTGAGAIDALVAELGLEQEKGRFLFRSGDMAMDSEGYDSVLVGNLLLALLEKLTREAQEAGMAKGEALEAAKRRRGRQGRLDLRAHLRPHPQGVPLQAPGPCGPPGERRLVAQPAVHALRPAVGQG